MIFGRSMGAGSLVRAAIIGTCSVAASLLFGVTGVAADEITVHPGQSIQAAVDRAQPGDLVRVLPGTYNEAGRPCPALLHKTCAVVVSTDNIALRAVSAPGLPVVLKAKAGQDEGIAVAKQNAAQGDCLTENRRRIKGDKISGFTVRGFGEIGILLFCADHWVVISNRVENNLVYGVFALESKQGLIHRNTATRSHDTGIYVGQSEDILVDRNIAHDNVSGFEAESSLNVKIKRNEAFANTAGILAFIALDGKILASQGNRITDNYVHDNNSPNTCIDPEDEVCLVPPGIGIASLAGSQNRIHGNVVLRNETIGIALADICTVFQIDSAHCTQSNLGFDPLPESTRIVANKALGNGTNPQGGYPGFDLVWTLNGTGNCWYRNDAGTSLPASLPSCK